MAEKKMQVLSFLWHYRYALVFLVVLLSSLAFFFIEKKRDPIRVGVLFSQTGTMAVSEKPLADAVVLAIEEINQQGGLLGRPLEIIRSDGRSDDRVFASEAERLIVKEKISVLFACWTSSCRKSVKPVVEKYKHLLFYPLQYEGLETSPHIIYTGAVPNQQIIPGIIWASRNLGPRFFLVGSDYIFPRTANKIIRDFSAFSRISVLGESYLPLGSQMVDGVVAEIIRLRPDVIINTINGDSNQEFFAALLQKMENPVPVLSFSVAEGELRQMPVLRQYPQHYAVWSYFQSRKEKSNQLFITAFRQRFGFDRAVSDPIESAYSSVKLWAGAVKECNSELPEHTSRSIEQQSLHAPSGVMAVDEASHHVWRFVYVGKARSDGQFDIVYASERALRPEPFPAYRSVPDWQKVMQEIAHNLESKK